MALATSSASSSTTTTMATTTPPAMDASPNTPHSFLFRQGSSGRAASHSSKSSLTLADHASLASPSVASSSRCAATFGEHNKDALCRRMGALFLRHKVDQLADDVEKMQQQQQSANGSCPFQRRKGPRCGRRNVVAAADASTSDTVGEAEKRRSSDSIESGKTGKAASCSSSWKQCRARKAEGKTMRGCHRAAVEEAQAEAERATASRTTLLSDPSSSAPPSSIPSYANRIIVADVSLLIYSLRTVHQWLKAGDCRVIVPCEALSTLDVLKKGDHFLNLAARRATRFLDERFSAATSIPPEHSTAEAKAVAALQPGLFPQGMRERLDWTGTLSMIDGSTDTRLASKGLSLETLSHAPLPVAKTLACAMYFVRQYSDRTDVSCSLAISLPPPHLDFDELSSGRAVVDGQQGERASTTSCPFAGQVPANLRYAERADGNNILHWAKTCGLAGDAAVAAQRLIVAPTAVSWLTAGPRLATAQEHGHEDAPRHDGHLRHPTPHALCHDA